MNELEPIRLAAGEEEAVEVIGPGEVVEAEVVGPPCAPPAWWRRLAAKALLSLLLGALGVLALLIGAALTLTIVGASIGIPLALLGLFLCAAAVLLPFIKVTLTSRNPGHYTEGER